MSVVSIRGPGTEIQILNGTNIANGTRTRTRTGTGTGTLNIC